VHDLSIITPTLNSARFIQENIKSINKLKEISIQHIIVDGHSKDETLELVSLFPSKDNIEREVYQRNPAGVSDAINFGIQCVKTPYFIVIHSDDLIFHPEILISNLHELQNSNKDWSISPTYFFRNKNQITKDTFSLEKITYSNLIRGNFISHPGVIIKTPDSLDEVQFDVNLSYALDYELWLRLFQRKKPYIFFECWAAYRHHSNALSNKYALRTKFEALKVRQMYSKNLIHKFTNILRFVDSLVHYFINRVNLFLIDTQKGRKK
jgi:glycosyltransferase involved in cell wall biosynthesis